MRRLNSNKIIALIEKHKNDLRKYNVKKIGLFGSYLKMNHNPKSDLDFLVTFNHLSYDNYIELKFFLEKLFNRKIDLVIEKSLKPSLKYVTKEALYAKRL